MAEFGRLGVNTAAESEVELTESETQDQPEDQPEQETELEPRSLSASTRDTILAGLSPGQRSRAAILQVMPQADRSG